MNNWIEPKRKVEQSTSKLPVEPSQNTQQKRQPVVKKQTAELTNKLAVTKTASVEDAQPQRIRSQSGQKVPVLVAATARVVDPGDAPTINISPDRSDSVSLEDAVMITLPDGTVLPESMFEPRGLGRFSYFYGLPSWLVSFIFHLLLLLILALFSMAAKNGAQILDLEMGTADAVAMDMFDVSVDMALDPLDDANQLEVSETLSASELAEESFDEMELLETTTGADLASVSDGSELEGSGAKLNSDGNSARFFGAAAAGSKFVFVVDCSGSMDDEYRWDTARRELKRALDELKSNQRFYIFLYNSAAYGMTTKAPKLVRATQENRKEALYWLSNSFPMGNTMPWRAVEESLVMKPDAVFFLSDGELDDQTVRLLKMKNHEGGKVWSSAKGREITLRKQVPIHTIFLGRGDGQQTMEVIAKENGGTFTPVRQ